MTGLVRQVPLYYKVDYDIPIECLLTRFISLLAGSRRTVSFSFFVSEVAVSPWDVVRQFAPPPGVVCVEDMKDITTDFGKVD